MGKVLFDWPIVLQYNVKAKYRLISRKFFGHEVFQPSARLTNQKPRAFVFVRQTNQVALFPFVCCFYFVLVFTSRSYENRSITERQRKPRSSEVIFITPCCDGVLAFKSVDDVFECAILSCVLFMMLYSCNVMIEQWLK